MGNSIATSVLLGWPLVSLVFFATLGPWRGVIATYVGAYLLLPYKAMIPMSGIPDYTKFTAANLAALAGVFLFDASRLASFRPKWYDFSVLLMCLTPVASFRTNGLETWPMVSATSGLFLRWGVPYFIGRLYASQPGADRTLAVSLVVAGLLTIPALGFEVVTSRSLSVLLYGEAKPIVYKYGLYSPSLMAANALEMGIWTSLLAVIGFALWCTRSVSSLLGVPFGTWAAVLATGPILCHQTAAMGIFGFGVFLIALTAGKERFGSIVSQTAAGAVLVMLPKLGGTFSVIALFAVGAMQFMRNHRPRLLTLCFILIPSVYLFIRVTNLISREALTAACYSAMGGSRAYSLDFRMIMEEFMLDHVMQQPFFGWATFEDGRAWGAGAMLVDSMWIIHTAQFGLVGLTLLYASLGLPVYLTTLRRPVEVWKLPINAAAMGLAVVVLLYTLDSLLNMYTIIVIPMIMGLLMGLPAPVGGPGSRLARGRVADRRLEQVNRLAMLGRFEEAEAVCRRLISSRSADRSGHATLADSFDRLADLLEVLDRLDEAEEARRRALQLRVAVASGAPGDFEARAAMADGAEQLARLLSARGRPDEAAEVREMALGQRAALAAADPDDPVAFGSYVDGLNDLAWLLSVGGGGRTVSDLDRAVAMAEQAVRLCPSNKSYWNTLGACYHRSGDHGAALAAIRRSLGLGPDSSGFDEVIRSLALASLGDPEGAREALARVDSLLGDGSPAPASLLRLRTEATRAIGSNLPAVIR